MTRIKVIEGIKQMCCETEAMAPKVNESIPSLTEKNNKALLLLLNHLINK
jgi:hypothetical protein